ncbi:MAG: cytochrome c-type biogenesis protein CcmH [Magnetococcales bacterium]|nr:cytochrome c-type biogenesis protein CcmH [Magnetococcales bacterium]NGZ26312.1 cytochrome c-type biogenesis protein CcmH [Magnetococcales bacterium]
MIARLLPLLLACMLTVSWAGELKEDPSESLTRKIAKDLRCAVCQNQSIYDSNSDLAKDMLNIIREKVNAGEEEAAIRQYFHQRYGDYIYLEPTRHGGNWLLWLAPFVGLLIGGYALWRALQRWRNPPVVQAPAQPNPQLTMSERIQQELNDVQL